MVNLVDPSTHNFRFTHSDLDTYHSWISITLGALTQGALVDVLDRFPWLAKIALMVFRKKIYQLTADTRANEAMSLEAVQRYNITVTIEVDP